MTSLADLLASVFDRRKVWPAPARPGEKSIAELAFELVGSAGEASGLASAAAILASYSSLDDVGKLAFFRMLSVEMNIFADKVSQALDLYEASPSKATYRDFAAAAEPPRQELIRRLNRVPGATGSLVRMRADLLRWAGASQILKHWTWIFGISLRPGSTVVFWCCDRSVGKALHKSSKRSSPMRLFMRSTVGRTCGGGWSLLIAAVLPSSIQQCRTNR